MNSNSMRLRVIQVLALVSLVAEFFPRSAIHVGTGVGIGIVAASSPACTDPVRRGTTVAVVTAGGAISALVRENEQVYQEATDSLRAELARDGGTQRDYAERSAALNDAFDRRTRALSALSSALYGAAAMIDATRSGAPATAYLGAAAEVLRSVETTMPLLTAPVGNMRGLTVPQELQVVLSSLRALLQQVGGGIDAGR